MTGKGTVILSMVCLSWMMSSCSGDNNPFERANNFEQGPMLEHYSESLIVPAYAQLKTASGQLVDSLAALMADLSVENLMAARNQLKSARLAWQQCSFYEFGPAENLSMTSSLNLYPVDANQISQNISSGNYDLTLLANQDARGFPAMEYLLYGVDMTDEMVLQSLDASTLNYLYDLAKAVEGVCSATYNEWNAAGGNYVSKFTAESALGVDVGSSVGQMVNGFIRHFERHVRDGKIGIPVGIRSLGEPLPQNAEAYFAGYSIELFKASIESYQAMFNGLDGIGYDDYLKEIGAFTLDNQDLADRINNQFAQVIIEAEKLNGHLPEAIGSQKEQVELLFAEMQTLVTLFKTDMASSLGVIISYQDTDGD